MLAPLQTATESASFLTLDLGDWIQVGVAIIMLWAVRVSRRSAEAAEKGVQAAQRSADAGERSAGAARDSVEATREGIRAQLLYQLSSEFWSEEFGKACSDLAEFSRRDDFVETYRQDLAMQDGVAALNGPEAPLVGPPRFDMERRRIKGYYHTVKQLHDAAFFTREEVKERLTSAANTSLLLGPVEQLETVLTAQYDPEDEEQAHLYQFFGELYPELERPVLEWARRQEK